jgi:hypothetical protein
VTGVGDGTCRRRGGDVEQGGTRETPSYQELERALSSVPGIVHAAVAVADGSGRGRLRIRLAPGEDPEQIAWAVAATLRERFGISLDPETIRPRLQDGDPPSDGLGAPHAGSGPADDRAPADAGSAPADDRGPAATTAQRPRAAGASNSSQLQHGDADDRHDALTAVPPPAVPPPSVTPPAVPPTAGPPTAGPPAAIAPDPGASTVTVGAPDPAAVAGVGDGLSRAAGPRVRAAIRDLVTRQGDDDVEVTATLEVGDRQGRAAARAVPTRRGVWRAVAEATVGALRELTDDHLRAGVDRVTVTSSDDPGMVTVVLTVLSDRGEETLLGAALLRDDPEGAVMRATLDALNRRVEPLLCPPAASV